MNWATQTELLAGTSGAHSHSMNGSVPPDRVQIVPFTISVPGTNQRFRAAGILRLWKRDGEGGSTFMLSLGHQSLASERFLDALYGGPGFVVTVAPDLSRLTTAEALLGTSPST